jgi:hypothetical protein
LDQQRGVGIARYDGRLSFGTGLAEAGDLGHDVVALGLGRLVTAVTFGLEEGADLAVIADLGGSGRRRFRRGSGVGGEQGAGEEQGRSEPESAAGKGAYHATQMGFWSGAVPEG